MIVTGSNRRAQTERFPFSTPVPRLTRIKSNPDLRGERSVASLQNHDMVSPHFHENLSLVTVLTTSHQMSFFSA